MCLLRHISWKSAGYILPPTLLSQEEGDYGSYVCTDNLVLKQ